METLTAKISDKIRTTVRLKFIKEKDNSFEPRNSNPLLNLEPYYLFYYGYYKTFKPFYRISDIFCDMQTTVMDNIVYLENYHYNYDGD